MKARFPSFPTHPNPPKGDRSVRPVVGFTLVELLVSMAVLILIVGLLGQLVSHTTDSIQHSTKGMDNNQAATLALDRLGNSMAGMVSSGAATLVVYKNATGSDGLAMITNGRVRSRAGGTDGNINAASFTDIRMGARGFCVINTADSELPSTPAIPMLNWGDGTITWSTGNNSASVQSDPSTALSLGTQDVIYQATGNGQPGNMLNFTPLSRGIFRLELAFLLSNGKIVSGSGGNLALAPGLSGGGAPLPQNRYFVKGEVFDAPPATIPAGAYPLAFNAATSDAAPDATVNATQNVYVRAVIVGIASLDGTTQKILTGDQLKQLASLQIFPKLKDGQTPAQVWSTSVPGQTTYQQLSPPNFPPPVIQNVRVTQRYYYVN